MTLFYAVLFLIGLGFGSFASVIIHRLRNKEKGIFWGRSHCPLCKHVLSALDLIPLAGYLINKFRCRYCKAPIALRYPFLELTMGCAFLTVAWQIGFTKLWLLVYTLFLTFIFVALSFYDILYQEIPDEISLPTIGLAGFIGFFAQLHAPKSLLLGFLVPVAFFAVLFLGSRGRWLGGGDVRIGAIMGFVLGWPVILVGLFLGYLLGSVFSLFGLLTGKLNRKTPIPFGPFLFIGTFLSLFWGQAIIDWYLGMM